MRIRTRTHTSHTLEIDDVEVPLEHLPCDEDAILTERVGDTLIVAYLVRDGDPSNPLKDGDCNGDLYTLSSRGAYNSLITDNNREIHNALGLDGYGEVDLDSGFDVGGQYASLRVLAADAQLEKLANDPEELDRWLDLNGWVRDPGETQEQVINHLRTEILADLEDPSGSFYEEVEALAVKLYPLHWKTIAGPYVVPMYYNSGSYDTTISLDEWDGDPEEPPNCIWVADKGAIENITPYPEGVEMAQVVMWPEPRVYAVMKDDVEIFRGDWSAARSWIRENLPAPGDAEIRSAAARYAEGVCNEYASWCSGEVYGCVVETFSWENGEWIQQVEDACWGYVGSEHAEESLRAEFFAPAIAKAREVTA